MSQHPQSKPGWAALGLCVASAAIATATTLILGPLVAPQSNAAPGHEERVTASDQSRLAEDILALQRTVRDLAARVAAKSEPANSGNDRQSAAGYALASDLDRLQKRLDGIDAEVRTLKESGADPRSGLVASRRRKAKAGPEEVEQIVAIRTQRYGLDRVQAEHMRELEFKWQERDKVVVGMWESGANLAVLSRHIEQDEEAYQAEIEAILTPQQREQRRAEIVQNGRAFVAR